jgi:hypothetical protein
MAVLTSCSCLGTLFFYHCLINFIGYIALYDRLIHFIYCIYFVYGLFKDIISG